MGSCARTPFSRTLLPWPILCYSGQNLHVKVLEHLVWSNASGFQFWGPPARTNILSVLCGPRKRAPDYASNWAQPFFESHDVFWCFGPSLWRWPRECRCKYLRGQNRFRNARLWIFLFVRNFWRVLLAILAECSQFCLRSFYRKSRGNPSLCRLGGGGSRGTRIANKNFVNKLAFSTDEQSGRHLHILFSGVLWQWRILTRGASCMGPSKWQKATAGWHWLVTKWSRHGEGGHVVNGRMKQSEQKSTSTSECSPIWEAPRFTFSQLLRECSPNSRHTLFDFNQQCAY